MCFNGKDNSTQTTRKKSTEVFKCSSCLVPRSIVNESENVILQFNKVVDKLFKHQQLNNKEAEKAKLQFEEFFTNYVPRHSDRFNSFNVSMQRLDKFYGEFLRKN